MRGASVPRTIAEATGSVPAAHTREDIIASHSRWALDRALRDGTLVRLLPGIYVGARQARSFAARCHAVLLWTGDRGHIAASAAAHLHGLLATPPARITVALEPGRRLEAPSWVSVVRPTVRAQPARAGGLATVAVPDAVIGSWGELPPHVARSVVIEAIRSGRATPAAILTRADQLPRIRARRTLTRLLRDLDDGVESYLEHVAMTQVFNRSAFARFTRQAEVRVGKRRYRLDMFNADAGVAVELDGRRYHADEAARRRDLARDADLATLGITTIRLTFEDVTQRPEWCRDRVEKAVRARRSRRAT